MIEECTQTADAADLAPIQLRRGEFLAISREFGLTRVWMYCWETAPCCTLRAFGSDLCAGAQREFSPIAARTKASKRTMIPLRRTKLSRFSRNAMLLHQQQAGSGNHFARAAPRLPRSKTVVTVSATMRLLCLAEGSRSEYPPVTRPLADFRSNRQVRASCRIGDSRPR